MIAPWVLVLTLAFGNIKSNPTMPQHEVQHDTRALFSLNAQVVCGNEIYPVRYKRAFRTVADREGYDTHALGYANPVAVEQGVRVRVRKLSSSIPHLTPNRYATVVWTDHWTVVCTHLINRAWNSNDRNTPTRQRLYRQEMRVIRGIVRWHLSRGRTVVVGGDLNNPNRVQVHPNQVFLGNNDRMQAVVVPGPGVDVTRLRGRTIPNGRVYTDHPMLRRVIRLSN